jgi:hypothetical protein
MTRAVCGPHGAGAMEQSMSLEWPDIPYEPWRETCSALHLYTSHARND